MTEPIRVDLQTLTPAFANAYIYKKKGTVQARAAIVGEVIETVLSNGTVETSRTAKADDMVVTNPTGEQYVIGADKFQNRYEPTNQDGEYRARGLVRAFPNLKVVDVVITAPWGEDQFGAADCMFACALGGKSELTRDRYIIGREEFEATYEKVGNDFGTFTTGSFQKPAQADIDWSTVMREAFADTLKEINPEPFPSNRQIALDLAVRSVADNPGFGDEEIVARAETFLKFINPLDGAD